MAKAKQPLTKAALMAAPCPELRGVVLKPRQFSTGSYGFQGSGKINGKVNGHDVTYQVSANAIGVKTKTATAEARAEFLAKSEGMLLSLDDLTAGLHVGGGKLSEKGNVGYYCSGKAYVKIDGKPLQVQMGVNVTAIKSNTLAEAEVEKQAE